MLRPGQWLALLLGGGVLFVILIDLSCGWTQSPKWWFLLAAFLPCGMYYAARTSRLIAEPGKDDVPAHIPYLPAAVILCAAMVNGLLVWVFSFVPPAHQHQALLWSAVGLGLYLHHLANHVWLDFEQSRDMTVGYVSLALYIGGPLWLLHTAFQWSKHALIV